jgi:hypothetical protein
MGIKMKWFIRKWRNRLARFIHDPSEGTVIAVSSHISLNTRLSTLDENIELVSNQMANQIVHFLIKENFIKFKQYHHESKDVLEVKAVFNIINT